MLIHHQIIDLRFRALRYPQPDLTDAPAKIPDSERRAATIVFGDVTESDPDSLRSNSEVDTMDEDCTPSLFRMHLFILLYHVRLQPAE